jgi:hypothetical protein
VGTSAGDLALSLTVVGRIVLVGVVEAGGGGPPLLHPVLVGPVGPLHQQTSFLAYGANSSKYHKLHQTGLGIAPILTAAMRAEHQMFLKT